MHANLLVHGSCQPLVANACLPMAATSALRFWSSLQSSMGALPKASHGQALLSKPSSEAVAIPLTMAAASQHTLSFMARRSTRCADSCTWGHTLQCLANALSSKLGTGLFHCKPKDFFKKTYIKNMYMSFCFCRVYFMEGMILIKNMCFRLGC